MRIRRHLPPPACLLAAAIIAVSANPEAARAQGRQDPTAIQQTVEQFLREQSNGLPGKTTIEVGAVDKRLNLAPCPSPQAFFAPGSRAWGKTTVGVRCTAPSPWTLYVSAMVRVSGNYVAAAVPLASGQPIQGTDVVLVDGDLTALPPGTVTDINAAIGRTATQSFSVGAPLRQDLLRAQPAVQQGQVVRLVSSGPGFRVSLEGKALGSGIDGQTVQARTPAGQVVTGIARNGGILEVAY